jgi:lysophospholipase L1-like esterase
MNSLKSNGKDNDILNRYVSTWETHKYWAYKSEKDISPIYKTFNIFINNGKERKKMIPIKYLVTCLLLIASSGALAAPPTFPLPHDQWQMIALPATPPANANTVEKILGDNMTGGGDYGQNWVVYAYDTASNGYGSALALTDTMEVGKGYWIIQNFKEGGVTLDMPENSAETPASELIPLAASKDDSNQWNLAGNPFSTSLAMGDLRLKTNAPSCNDGSCDLDKAQANNLTHNKVWTYNGNSYEEKGTSDRIDAWAGFWVATLSGSKDYSLSLSPKIHAIGGTIGARPVKSTPLSKGKLFASINGDGDCMSKESPCKINKAFAKLSSENNVLFLRGNEGAYEITEPLVVKASGAENNPIIIESYPGEQAILTAYATKEKVRENNMAQAAISIVGDQYQYIHIRKLEIKNMGGKGIYILRSSNNKIEGCEIHDNFNTAISIYANSEGGVVADNNLIIDNTLYNNTDVGLKGSWNNCYYSDGDSADGVAIVRDYGHRNQILHNTVFKNSDDGIDVLGSQNSYVAFNLTSKNGAPETISGNGNGIKACSIKGAAAKVEYNISFDNKEHGFDCHYDRNTGVVFKHNTAYGNGRLGFGIESGKDVKIINNIASENKNIENEVQHGIQQNNSWQKGGIIQFISTDSDHPDFLKPTVGGGFENIGAYAASAGVDKAAKIFLIGDSTVHNDDFGGNEKGWGDTMGRLLTNPGNLFNRARSGAGSGSYKDDKNQQRNWTYTKDMMTNADIRHGGYLFIQFGHNEEDYDSFYSNLHKYVAEARRLRFTPVLITPVSRLWKYDGSHKEYPQIVQNLANNENVLLLDLYQKSWDEFNKYEDHNAVAEKFGFDDHTHFNPEGASIVAGWVKELICSKDLTLCNQFKE